jgi:hypothetical protein
VGGGEDQQLTGGDIIKARFMRQDFFDYRPAFKLVIAGNHKPGLRSVDEAIRRRFNLVPFTITIPPAERDETLAEQLKQEFPGILQWPSRAASIGSSAALPRRTRFAPRPMHILRRKMLCRHRCRMPASGTWTIGSGPRTYISHGRNGRDASVNTSAA